MPEFYLKLLFNFVMMVFVTITLLVMRNYSHRIQDEKTKELSDTKTASPSLRRAFIIALYVMCAELGILCVIVSLLSYRHQAPKSQVAAWIVLSISVLVLIISRIRVRIRIPRPKYLDIVLIIVPNILTVFLMSLYLIFGTPNHFKYTIPLAFAVATLVPTCVYMLACLPYLNKNQ